MAGNSSVLNTPYPGNPEGVIWLTFKPFDIVASKTNHVVDKLRVPWGFKPVRCEYSAGNIAITSTASFKFDVFDDASTPNVIVDDETLTSADAHASGATSLSGATLDDTGSIDAGSILGVRYTTTANATGTKFSIRLAVRPLYK